MIELQLKRTSGIPYDTSSIDIGSSANGMKESTSFHAMFKVHKRNNPTAPPLKSPPLPQSRKHRMSCHRCGNMRKNRVCCVSCVTMYCAKCADKMVGEHGGIAFVDGCPVCKKLCCCWKKTPECTHIYHCYKKCPRSRTLMKKNKDAVPKRDKLSQSQADNQTNNGITSNPLSFDLPPHIAKDITSSNQSAKRKKSEGNGLSTNSPKKKRGRPVKHALLTKTKDSEKPSSADGVTSARLTCSSTSTSTGTHGSASSVDPREFASYFESMIAVEAGETSRVSSSISLQSINNSISRNLLHAHCESGDNDCFDIAPSHHAHAQPPPEDLPLFNIFSGPSPADRLCSPRNHQVTTSDSKSWKSRRFQDKYGKPSKNASGVDSLGKNVEEESQSEASTVAQSPVTSQ